MELFERVKYLLFNGDVSQASIARKIGVLSQSFNQWLNPKSQKNLWEHLPVILEMFPHVRREWLYFGEGEILVSHDEISHSTPEAPAEDIVALQTKVAELEAELREADRLNRQLTTRLLIDGTGDKDGAKSTVGKAADGQ